MLIKHRYPYEYGYNEITNMENLYPEMLMDFGILKLADKMTFNDSIGKERAFLLITGDVIFEWGGKKERAVRKSNFDENPWVLHVPKNIEVKITANAESELCVQKTNNSIMFESKLYKPDEIESAEFGKGTMKETSTRTVRTVFDAASAPWSNMVLGEVINHPGKWSSYPPHDHPQPEIYHMRFYPENGFGFSGLEEEAFVVKNNDTVTLDPGKTHSQVSAPGYAMYYIWMIPHLENEKFGPDSRNFREEHKWLMDPKAVIWPDKE